MDNNSTYISQFAKEFEIETRQIHYWFDTLGDIKRQIELLKEGVESETKLYETLGKGMQLMTRGFLNDSAQYADEPSNLNGLFKSFIALIDCVGKTFSEDILMLNVQASKFHSVILNEIFSLKRSIGESSHTLMQEIQDLKKKSKIIQGRYEKLKVELEEAHTSKKKLENDPKYVYNVTMKEKAEKKILDYIKQMQDLMPELDTCAKDLENKKNLFNANMKQTFELVIATVFKFNIKINQTFFMVSKEKFDIMLKLKQKANQCCRNILDVDLQLNDYVERKYAEKKQIYFDSIDLLRIGDNLFDGSLITVAESLINYTNNFYNCMKLRKRALQIFAKMISDQSKSEEVVSSNYSKVNKGIVPLIEGFLFIGRGNRKNWDLFKNAFDINFSLHDTLSKYLSTNVYTLILHIVKESKADYTNFNDSWSKRAKDILNYKAVLQKFQMSKEKIQNRIKELRNSVGGDNKSMDKSKYESKLSSLYAEEEQLKKSFENTGKKIKGYFDTSLDLLKKTIKLIREKEFKRLNTFIETIESVSKNFEKTFDQNLHYAKSQMNMSAGADIFEDIKEVFDDYFTKFKISSYDGFLEKVVRKTLDKVDLESADNGENMNNIFNNYISNNLSTSFKNLNNFNSGGLRQGVLRKFDSGNSSKKNSSIDGVSNYINEEQIQLHLSNNQASQENFYPKQTLGLNKFATHNKQSMVTFNKRGEIHLSNSNISNMIPIKKNGMIDEEEEMQSFSRKDDDVLQNQVQTAEEDDINFVNYDHFKMIDTKNPYHNIKEQELKEYFDKINNKGARERSKSPNGNNINNDNSSIFSNNLQEPRRNSIVLYDNIFTLEDGEKVIETFSCAYKQKILLQGKMYLTNKKIVFYSWFNNKTLFGHTKLIIPLVEVVRIEKKYNLKIFDNSINIVTKKSELFFTSFVQRDNCYKILTRHWDNTRKHEEEKEKDEDSDDECGVEVNEKGNNTRTTQNLALMKSNYIAKMLKRIDFLNRLEKVHQQRMNDFLNANPDEFKSFKPENTFKKTYFKDEFLSNCPLPLVYLNLFDRNTVCEELGKGKCFWESLYEMRNDYDLQFSFLDNTSECIPNFFQDIEQTISLFGNPEEESFETFLNDVSSWPKALRYHYNFMHPIKKKLIGPDRLRLKQEFNIYFVSPKCLIIEDIGYGYEFPYADCFVTTMQYRFDTNYKYSVNEGIFKFSTSFTCMFTMDFVKSCFFKGMIEDEGYKESLENVKFNTWEKFKTVLDSQTEVFKQHFEILSEENLRKTMNSGGFFKVDEDNGNQNENEIKEYASESADDSEDENGWKVAKQNEFSVVGNDNFFSRNLLRFTMILPIVILICIIFYKVNFEVTVNISFEKIFNLVVIILIGVLFYRFNSITNKEKQFS